MRTAKPSMAEAHLQQAVLDLARLRGWLAVHFRPAMLRSGRYVTAMQGDAGFPDLVLAGHGRLILAELKVAGRSPELAQRRWLDALAFGPAETHCWRPVDLASGAIARVLHPAYDPAAGSVPQWSVSTVGGQQ